MAGGCAAVMRSAPFPLSAAAKPGHFGALGQSCVLERCRRMARYRVAVDTGGTFSDFVYLNEDNRRGFHHQSSLDA